MTISLRYLLGIATTADKKLEWSQYNGSFI